MDGVTHHGRRARPAKRIGGLLVAAALVAPLLADPSSAQATGSGFAGTPVTLLDQSGAWSWFEGPQATITDCELLVSSVDASGTTDIATTDLASGATRVDAIGGPFEVDDHNSAGLLALPDGRIIGAWSRHHRDLAIQNVVRPDHMWNWYGATPVRTTTGRTTYSNLVQLLGEGGRIYNFFRGNGFNPNVVFSDDGGHTWSDPAPFIRKYGQRPYPVFDDDANGRIDVATTGGHPMNGAEVTTIFHAFVSGNRIRESNGAVVAPTDFGVAPEELTPVFEPTAVQRAWTQDIIGPTASTGTTIVFSIRDVSDGLPAHARNQYYFARYDGSAWNVSPIAWAGNSLYSGEPHYMGGVAIDPADPNHLVISTDVDPATGAPLTPAPGRSDAAHELYDAVTADGGQTWTFTPITSSSATDNLRPVIPDPSATTRALVWFRGQYSSYLSYDTEVVGMIDGSGSGGPCTSAPLKSEASEDFAGDFDGDGLTDWFIYTPGPGGDAVYWGDGDHTNISVNGTYTPRVQRVAGGSDHILWSNPGGSYRWRASGHSFVSTTVVHAAGVRLLTGDFDGDGLDDVFHYRPGSARDRIYWTSGGSTPVFVNGTYQPLVGEFSGDSRDDILWYAPGATADFYWRFQAGRRWASSGASINGTYTPAIGQIDGNGTDDIFWRRPSGGGYHWLTQPGATLRYADRLVR